MTPRVRWLTVVGAVLTVVVSGCASSPNPVATGDIATPSASRAVDVVATPAPHLRGGPDEFVGTFGRRLAVFDADSGKLERMLTTPPSGSWDAAVAVVGRAHDERVVFIRQGRVLEVSLHGQTTPTRLTPKKCELNSAAISQTGATLAYEWQACDEGPAHIDVVSVATGSTLAKYEASPDGGNGPLSLGVIDVNDRYVLLQSSAHLNAWLHRIDFRSTPSAVISAFPNVTRPGRCSPFAQQWLRTPRSGAIEGVEVCRDEWVYVHAGSRDRSLRVTRELPVGAHSWAWSPDSSAQFLIGASRRSILQLHGQEMLSLPCPDVDRCPYGLVWQ